MWKKSPYQPIDCEFHDTLEEACVLKLRVDFQFVDDNGDTQNYSGQLLDFKTKDGEEFVKLQDGKWLRLDKLNHVKISPKEKK